MQGKDMFTLFIIFYKEELDTIKKVINEKSKL